jgi:Lrp/AsnC family transcriptional regulator, leucine-responsive regulatory protein
MSDIRSIIAIMEQESFSLDDIDRRILEILQDDGRMSVSQLAEHLSLSEAPCWRRVKRLQESGHICEFRAIADRRKLGFGVLAFVNVQFTTHDMHLAGEFEQAVLGLPCILSCHNVTGEIDYVLTVIAKDLDDYGRFTTVLRNLPGVRSITSSLALREVKSKTSIPA